jgi:apolipoprotein N-acyltransferase
MLEKLKSKRDVSQKQFLNHILLFIFSFFIVGFAQPDWSIAASFLAASIGYSLYWKGMLVLTSKKLRFFSAMLWFAGISLLHLNWFLADRYVGIYIYPVILLLSGGLGLQFATISLLIRTEKTMSLLSMLAISGAWVLCEWSRLFILSGFSFDPVGLALTSTLTSLQMASAIGIYGLSFWVFFTNLIALKLSSSFSWRKGLFFVMIASFPYCFGYVHLVVHSFFIKKKPQHSLSVLLVQTALIPELKQQIGHGPSLSPAVQWENILRLLAPYQNGSTKLIVLPEGTVPYGTHYPLYSVEKVSEIFQKVFGRNDFLPLANHSKVGNLYVAHALSNLFNSDIIIGLEDTEPRNEGITAYNAAFLVSPHKGLAERYEKRIVVPMGEYIPFEWCKGILSKYGIADSYTPGGQAKIFHGMQDIHYGISICYEETYGHLMRENRKLGANILVNITNDVWYPRSRLPSVHFFHGRLRAVEEGIPQLRACNTGITCGIDALGREIAKLPYDCPESGCLPGVLPLNLPLYSYPTLYALSGDYLVISFSTLFFIVFCVSHLYKEKKFHLNIIKISLLRKN